ncbi:MAG: calcium-binding protein, partial [Candidatus Nanopelagicaceae bacterium]
TELGTNFANDFGTVTDDATAANSAEKIVYNTSNGSLFYNPNGTADGFDEGGQFASIFDQPELSADNFILT